MSHPDTPRPRLAFAHANGFPGGSYQSLLEPLEDTFDVYLLECLGQDPAYPPGRNWETLTDELLASLPEGEPLLGVGHSLGGVLMAKAARRCPERFLGVIMLDPPLMLGRDVWLMKAAKGLGFVDRVTPAGKTLRRRREWPSREVMARTLRRRGLFRGFTDAAMADYVRAGTREQDDGSVALSFDPDAEVAIFRHLPDNLSRLPRALEVPAFLVAGEDSELRTPARMRRFARSGLGVLDVPGTHMFPMEHPEATRDAIRRAWDNIQASRG